MKKREVQKKNKPKQSTETGILKKFRKGFGFVLVEDREQDIFIPRDNMNGAMDGDKVLVEIFEEAQGNRRTEGQITTILDRATTEVVGTFIKDKKYGFVISENRNFRDDIFIRKANFGAAKNGDKVAVKIIKYPVEGMNAEGRVTEIVAGRNEPGGDIKAMARAFGYKEEFPKEVQKEAKDIAAAGVGNKFGDRVDLRNKIVFTIDGADAKDFDDAVSIEKTAEGNYLLGVHIADVAEYVREGSPLDIEAFSRGTSAYLINQVIPMLPFELSNDICSLRPNENRLTLSVDMMISPQGEIIGHNIYESIICSSERMIYDDVSDIIEAAPCAKTERYKHIIGDIMMMAELADILRKKRMMRGSLDFEIGEADITLDERGVAVGIDLTERRVANRLIEEFMLVANETVAEYYFWLEFPFLYRVHEKPDTEKLQELKVFLSSFGIRLPMNSDSIHPRELAKILKEIKGKTYENVVGTVMLRTMKKASYEAVCEGHFGLSLKYYCHFTSPIRRYPDLMIHRLIKEYLKGVPSKQRMDKLKKASVKAAANSSACERKAIELERNVEKMKKTEYMLEHIGEVYEGIVSGVNGNGIFVELENTVEGMIRLSDLTDDYYEFDPKRYRVVGTATKKIYTMGQRVKIKVQDADVQEREITFSLVRESNKR